MTYHGGGGLGFLYCFWNVSVSLGIYAAFFLRQLRGRVFFQALRTVCAASRARGSLPPIFPRLPADFSPAAALPFFSPEQSAPCSLGFSPLNNPLFKNSCLIFEIFWHVWVTFLVGYPTRTFPATCSHIFMGSATYIPENVDPPLLQIDWSVY